MPVLMTRVTDSESLYNLIYGVEKFASTEEQTKQIF
jgi:hypothetical protein